MEKAVVIFVSLILVISVALGGLGYVYISGGQEAFTGNPDNGTEPSEPDDGGDTVPEPDNSLPVAPDFDLPRVGGGYVRLSDLQGQVVVLDFMATWCGPCETELAHLREIYDSYGQVRILSIDVDQSEGEGLLSNYIEEHNIQWDVLMDTAGISQASGYEATSIPTLAIIDQDGRIAFRSVGVTDSSILKSEIDALL